MNLSSEMSSKQLIEIGYDLQRQLRAKEAAAKKEKAILEQKIELLEKQINEAKEREDNMRKMYDTMITALKPSENNKPAKELELINEMHKKELAENKQKHIELANNFERQIDELRGVLGEREHEIEKLKMQNEVIEKKYKEELVNSNRILKDLQEKLVLLENMKDTKELNVKHNIDPNEIKQKYDQSLKEIKKIYEGERIVNKEKLEKANNEIKTLKQQHEDYRNREQQHLNQIKYLQYEIKQFSNNAEGCIDKSKWSNKENIYLSIRNGTDAVVGCKEDLLIRKLKHTEKALENIKREYKKLETKYKRTETELLKMKEVYVIIEEQKANSNSSLKTEIKSLISKLNRTKVKLVKNTTNKVNSIDNTKPLESNTERNTSREIRRQGARSVQRHYKANKDLLRRNTQTTCYS